MYLLNFSSYLVSIEVFFHNSFTAEKYKIISSFNIFYCFKNNLGKKITLKGELAFSKHANYIIFPKNHF